MKHFKAFLMKLAQEAPYLSWAVINWTKFACLAKYILFQHFDIKNFDSEQFS